MNKISKIQQFPPILAQKHCFLGIATESHDLSEKLQRPFVQCEMIEFAYS